MTDLDSPLRPLVGQAAANALAAQLDLQVGDRQSKSCVEVVWINIDCDCQSRGRFFVITNGKKSFP